MKYAGVEYARESRSRTNSTMSSCQIGSELSAMSDWKSRMKNSSPKRF